MFVRCGQPFRSVTASNAEAYINECEQVEERDGWDSEEVELPDEAFLGLLIELHDRTAWSQRQEQAQAHHSCRSRLRLGLRPRQRCARMQSRAACHRRMDGSCILRGAQGGLSPRRRMSRRGEVLWGLRGTCGARATDDWISTGQRRPLFGRVDIAATRPALDRHVGCLGFPELCVHCSAGAGGSLKESQESAVRRPNTYRSDAQSLPGMVSRPSLWQSGGAQSRNACHW